jgi:hypothetical protein
MNSSLLVGFAVCSRNNGFLDTAVFDNVSITGLWPLSPGAPATLSAMPGDTQATLNWSAATNATGYNLKRANSSAGPYATVAANLNGLSYMDSGLANGALYFYVISGTNIVGESTNSNPASVRPVSLAPPFLSFDAAGGQLQFSWPTDHVGWELQGQTNPPGSGLSSTNWFFVTGSGATDMFSIPINLTSGNAFYRLIYP